MHGSLFLQMSHLAVTKIWLENIILTQEIPLELHSVKGSHFTGQISNVVCEIWHTIQHFHCAYQPQFSGLVERTSVIIKTQLVKLSEAFNLFFFFLPQFLPIVLLNVRSTHFGKQIVTLRNKYQKSIIFGPGLDELLLVKGDILYYC